jgi:hypothetical protein
LAIFEGLGRLERRDYWGELIESGFTFGCIVKV